MVDYTNILNTQNEFSGAGTATHEMREGGAKPSLLKNHNSWEHLLEDIENGGLEAATARRREIQQRDYADAMSGRDVPVITGFENAKSPAHDGKKKGKDNDAGFGDVAMVMDALGGMTQQEFEEALEVVINAANEILENLNQRIDNYNDVSSEINAYTIKMEIDGEEISVYYDEETSQYVDANREALSGDMQGKAARLHDEMGRAATFQAFQWMQVEYQAIQEQSARHDDLRDKIKTARNTGDPADLREAQEALEKAHTERKNEPQDENDDMNWFAEAEEPAKQNDVSRPPRSGVSVAGENETQERGGLPKMSEYFGNAAQPKEPEEPTGTENPETPKPAQGGQDMSLF